MACGCGKKKTPIARRGFAASADAQPPKVTQPKLWTGKPKESSG